MLKIMSFLVALEQIQAVKCLSTSRAIARKHGFRVVIQLMSSAVLRSCEDLKLASIRWTG